MGRVGRVWWDRAELLIGVVLSVTGWGTLEKGGVG